ncbi:gliding motility protein [Larkinella terrae]|uniref:Gliding motility protein n=1 Tax=Larkinella terrae TaxID=2025311 RepID=A0A7K0EP59_9BACT|nr:gliding motility protein [Larkinella terrae]MRS63579.1 gliding motility protein [Larkinella terrae]
MKISPVIFSLVSILIFNACSKTEELVTVEQPEQELFASRKPADVSQWLDKHKDIAQVYFGTTTFGKDTALVSELLKRVNDKELDVLYKQVNAEFGTLGDIQGLLSESFNRIHENFPDFKPPKVATMISGFMGPDLVISDTLVVIGLDYFAGPKAKYRPRGLPAYILRRYQKEFIVPTIVFALSDRFNKTNQQDQTLLADMIYYGKGYVFTKEMLPETPDSLIIGYTDQQLTQTNNVQSDIWAYFIDAKLLFEVNPAIKNRYMSERPFTAEISNKSPGAIGRWLGWRIVGKYYDEKDPGIKALMDNSNARDIFEKSGYKGLKDDN